MVNEFIHGVPELSQKSSEGVRQIQDWLKTGPLHLSDTQLDRYIDEAQAWINDNTSRFTSGALSTAATLAEVLTGTLLVLFATFFFLRDGRRIWRFLVRLLPVAARWKVDDAGRASWHTLGAYVRATVLVAFIDAVGIGIAWSSSTSRSPSRWPRWSSSARSSRSSVRRSPARWRCWWRWSTAAR